jgi:hypothetical protein
MTITDIREETTLTYTVQVVSLVGAGKEEPTVPTNSSSACTIQGKTTSIPPVPFSTMGKTGPS